MTTYLFSDEDLEIETSAEAEHANTTESQLCADVELNKPERRQRADDRVRTYNRNVRKKQPSTDTLGACNEVASSERISGAQLRDEIRLISQATRPMQFDTECPDED